MFLNTTVEIQPALKLSSVMNLFDHEKEKEIYFWRLWCLKKLHLNVIWGSGENIHIICRMIESVFRGGWPTDYKK